MRKVGFTGTQRGMTPEQHKAVYDYLLRVGEDFTFHHGDCVGADAQAHDIARMFGTSAYIVGHPPIDSKKRAYCRFDIELDPAPYIERNHSIIDMTDILIATPDGYTEKLRSGTWATVRYAYKRRKPVVLIYPNGAFKDEVDLHELDWAREE